MKGIIVILEILFVMYLWSQKCIVVLGWFLSFIMIQMSVEYGNESIYLQVIEDYPVQDCVKPRKMKIIFKGLEKLSHKDIPKEMYFSEIIKVIVFFAYSFLVFAVAIFDKDLASRISAVYICFNGLVSLICCFILCKKSFLARYKKINRYNINYLFASEDEPLPRKIGDCKIIAETKRLKRTYVTVRLLETGKIEEGVLLLGGKYRGNDSIYELYEICNVFYIISKE